MNDIKINEIHPVYLLHGSETFLIDDALKKITRSALSEEDMDFNMVVYDLEETPIETAIEEAETMPFLGDRKVVICKKAYFLTGVKPKKQIEHDLERLEQYIHNPSPDTVFVLVANYEKLDNRKKLNKKLSKAAAVIEASPANSQGATKFVSDLAKHLNVRITSDGCGRLLQMVGPNLVMLDSEVRKMSAYVGEGNEINEVTVDLLVAQTIEHSVFTLVEKVIERDHSTAFELLQSLYRQNEEPIKLLALLVGQLRKILHVSILEKEGFSQKEIASRLKIHPYVVKVASRQSRQFTQKQLLNAIERASETDYGMKSGKDKNMLLELFITSI